MNHLREILHQPAVVLVGWSLVHFLWQGLLVALMVAGVLRANRKASDVCCCARTARKLSVLPTAASSVSRSSSVGY